MNITEVMEAHFIVIKMWTDQEDIRIPNMYILTTIFENMWTKTAAVPEHIYNPTVLDGKFNITHINSKTRIRKSEKGQVFANPLRRQLGRLYPRLGSCLSSVVPSSSFLLMPILGGSMWWQQVVGFLHTPIIFPSTLPGAWLISRAVNSNQHSAMECQQHKWRFNWLFRSATPKNRRYFEI